MQITSELFDLEKPSCICGRPMRLKMIVPTPLKLHTEQCETHIFECGPCKHELRVMHDLPGSENIESAPERRNGIKLVETNSLALRSC